MTGSAAVLPHDVHGSGSGRPVVLLHSLALDRHVWDELAPILADGRRVYAVDLRGHGAGPKDDDFTVEDMATDVARTIEHLDLNDVALVGMSMGGCVAQSVAIHHPDRIGALALLDTTAWYGPDARATWESRAQKALTDGLGSLRGFQLDRWFGERFRAEHPEAGTSLLDTFVANDLPSYAAACRALGGFDARDQLSRIDVPTMVIVGEHDPATSPDHARALHDAIAGSQLHVITGAKHLTAVECSDEVAGLLGDIL